MTELSPRTQATLARLLPLVFMGLGALLLYFGAGPLRLAIASLNWPSAAGTIIAAEVSHHPGVASGSRGSYMARISYSYTVAGRVLHGNTLHIGAGAAASAEAAEAIVARYPPGQTVLVHYRAEHPETSVLEPGIHGLVPVLPGFGLSFLAAGGFLARRVWRRSP